MLLLEQNIYKNARIMAEAKYTIEEAAYALHIGESSLRAYERGERPVPDDVAADMVVLYDNIGLAQAHLKSKGRVAELAIPEIETQSLIQTAVELYTLVNEFYRDDSLSRLLAIAADNQIDSDERPDFDRIAGQIWLIIQKGLGLRQHCNVKKEVE